MAERLEEIDIQCRPQREWFLLQVWLLHPSGEQSADSVEEHSYLAEVSFSFTGWTNRGFQPADPRPAPLQNGAGRLLLAGAPLWRCQTVPRRSTGLTESGVKHSLTAWLKRYPRLATRRA